MADTIAAIATAPATGAIAIIRLSGDDALTIAQKVFGGKITKTRMMHYGEFIVSGDVIDNGLAAYMKAPNSYTGEDTVEFFCHGSLVVARAILEELYKNGARPAKAGEFTRRAFLNGKLELSQAEAVIDLIDAETVEGAKSAASQMAGRMGEKINSVRYTLLDLVSSFYAYVDYPDEDIEDTKIGEMVDRLREAEEKLTQMIDSFEDGKIIKDGVRCAIIGRPNAGKSSLLNAILGYERSIVSNIPGTTRDTVEERVRFGGVSLRLIDTAGIRKSEDAIEKIGIERTESAIDEAQLVLAVFDGSEELTPEDMRIAEYAKSKKLIAVVNKEDIAICIDMARLKEFFGENICVISAKNESGIEDLSKMVASLFWGIEINTSGEVVTNARHVSAIMRARENVKNATDALGMGYPPDVAISDLENAINALGEITGETASEQILTRIFERFCVGK
ncbi:MAG: tRNA uridine-5-carboxymethylaminomethyl(34) synthesis GTPase MnmE [Clostridia bacterium]|nr:tRNA uridine-5-carboxymethylaminomethyl(34) synthesis GTPase MnmE [Clostridia bacterium]